MMHTEAFVSSVSPSVIGSRSLCGAKDVCPMLQRHTESAARRTYVTTPSMKAKGAARSMVRVREEKKKGPTKSERNMMKKEKIVTTVNTLLEDSEMVFTIPLGSIPVKGIYGLRQELPEGVKAMAVKNKLMKRALEDSQWSVAEPLAKGSNLWFFVNEGNIKSTITQYKKFNKEYKKATINGGVLEGELYDGKGVRDISELPTKQESYQKIAMAIKAVPTKIARTTKEIPSKLARAIRLATCGEEGSSETTEQASAEEVSPGEASAEKAPAEESPAEKVEPST